MVAGSDRTARNILCLSIGEHLMLIKSKLFSLSTTLLFMALSVGYGLALLGTAVA
jgi:hypothetical protein